MASRKNPAAAAAFEAANADTTQGKPLVPGKRYRVSAPGFEEVPGTMPGGGKLYVNTGAEPPQSPATKSFRETERTKMKDTYFVGNGSRGSR